MRMRVFRGSLTLQTRDKGTTEWSDDRDDSGPSACPADDWLSWPSVSCGIEVGVLLQRAHSKDT